MKKSFTLIEILVTATIIAILSTIGVISYTQLSKQSRDGKRKVDLEQVRAALEMYRSSEDAYPIGSGWTTVLNSLTTPVVYIQSLPKDPKNPSYTYYYTSTNGIDYTLASHLETNTTTCQSLTSECTVNCTYCIGPYGEK